MGSKTTAGGTFYVAAGVAMEASLIATCGGVI
jgi:hypothetical protein